MHKQKLQIPNSPNEPRYGAQRVNDNGEQGVASRLRGGGIAATEGGRGKPQAAGRFSLLNFFFDLTCTDLTAGGGCLSGAHGPIKYRFLYSAIS